MKISERVFNLQNGHEYMVEMAIFNIQRAITPKVGKPKLRLMCSARCLMVLYICVKFRENITNGIRVMERTRVHGRNVMLNVQRVMTPNVGKPVLRFIFSAHCLMMLYMAVKFRENISNGIRVMKRIWNYKALTGGRTDTQNFGRYNIIPRNLVVINAHLCLKGHSMSTIFINLEDITPKYPCPPLLQV